MKNKILLIFSIFVLSTNFANAKRDTQLYLNCVNGALGDYFVNYWNEGQTYAQTVYTQTVQLCYANYGT